MPCFDKSLESMVESVLRVGDLFSSGRLVISSKATPSLKVMLLAFFNILFISFSLEIGYPLMSNLS
ncbi:hypothetical protein, partial [uncultured Helicobacter sp.]|uniref:hypothetical protein n=1 Tax=uncultured Helicobacter sp. TaxID=175537 RepID=UPI00374EE024